MHLQQTKAKSRASGGPQYYFHNLPEVVKDYLRRKGACPVVLRTPYGIARSPFMAVGRDHKLAASGKVIAGKVGHDRVQQASGDQSIGEAIRYWYGLGDGRDFERIDVEAEIHDEGHFILVPVAVHMRGRKRAQQLERVHAPLSFYRGYQSKLWRDQIEACRGLSAERTAWVAAQIARVVKEHKETETKGILESDLLRASGGLSMLGVDLSPYLGKGLDCVNSRFQFRTLPSYPCPVEIKKRSAGIAYQVKRLERHTSLPRAVILCMDHTLVNTPEHVDVIELAALAEYLGA